MDEVEFVDAFSFFLAVLYITNERADGIWAHEIAQEAHIRTLNLLYIVQDCAVSFTEKWRDPGLLVRSQICFPYAHFVIFYFMIRFHINIWRFWPEVISVVKPRLFDSLKL